MTKANAVTVVLGGWISIGMLMACAAPVEGEDVGSTGQAQVKKVGAQLDCASTSNKRAVCKTALGKAQSVRLVAQKSKAACILGTSYGIEGSDSIWVDKGCRGTFEVSGEQQAAPNTDAPADPFAGCSSCLAKYQNECERKKSEQDDAWCNANRSGDELTECLHTYEGNVSCEVDNPARPFALWCEGGSRDQNYGVCMERRHQVCQDKGKCPR